MASSLPQSTIREQLIAELLSPEDQENLKRALSDEDELTWLSGDDETPPPPPPT